MTPLSAPARALATGDERAGAPPPATARAVPKSPLALAIVDTTADFAALRGPWTELLAASAACHLFLTWEWLFTWWQHLAEGRRLFLVTLHADGRLVAIAPFVAGRRRYGPVSFPVLEFAGTGAVGSDYLDLIVRPGYEEAAVDAIADLVARRSVTLRLGQMREAALGRALADRLVAGGWSAARLVTDVCPFIDLSATSWDGYLAGLGASHRYNFKRRLRNLERSCDVSFERADTDDARHAALEALVALHRRRWEPRGGSDGLHTPAIVVFHEAFSALAAERGWLRLFLLRVNAVPVAAFYGFRYHGTFSFYQSGFEPTSSRQSVGLITLGLTIQQAIQEGAGEYDFLHGSEDYKFLWTDRTRPLQRIELYPPTAAGTAHGAAAAIRRRLGRWRRHGQPLRCCKEDTQ